MPSKASGLPRSLPPGLSPFSFGFLSAFSGSKGPGASRAPFPACCQSALHSREDWRRTDFYSSFAFLPSPRLPSRRSFPATAALRLPTGGDSLACLGQALPASPLPLRPAPPQLCPPRLPRTPRASPRPRSQGQGWARCHRSHCRTGRSPSSSASSPSPTASRSMIPPRRAAASSSAATLEGPPGGEDRRVLWQPFLRKRKARPPSGRQREAALLARWQGEGGANCVNAREHAQRTSEGRGPGKGGGWSRSQAAATARTRRRAG